MAAQSVKAIFALFGLLGLLAGPRPRSLGGSHPEMASPDQGVSLEASQLLEAKLRALADDQAGWEQIVITEREANSYLKFHGREFLPAGVREPRLHIQPETISGDATVDFDELNRTGGGSSDAGARLLAAVFSGKQLVSSTGRLETSNGKGKLTIEKVVLGTTEMPQWLVEWVVETYVARRYGIDLSKPFVLPDHVARVKLAPGRATLDRSPRKVE